MKLHQHDNGVTAFYRNEETFEYSSITGDLVIVTIPFSTMRFVEVDPFDSISHEKWKAIRELHYMPATKIGIQFKSRFWEEQGQLGEENYNRFANSLCLLSKLWNWGERTGYDVR